jgi:hypothetical protein
MQYYFDEILLFAKSGCYKPTPLKGISPTRFRKSLGIIYGNLLLVLLHAPRGLSMERHLPLADLLHLIDLIFNNNSLVDHVLKVCAICVEQLELNIIIQHIQEHVIFLFIGVDVIRGIS